MPPLRFFGRRWFIAGDEVGVLALTSCAVEAVLGLTYLCAPFIPAISGRGDRGPLVLAGDLHLVAMGVDLVLALVSSMGAAYEESRRVRALSVALFIRILLEVPKGVALVWLLIKGHLVMFCSDYAKVWKREDVTTFTAAILIALSLLQVVDIVARLGCVLLIGPRCPPVRDASEKPLLLAPSSQFFKILAFFGNAAEKEHLVQTLLVQFMDGFDWTVGDALQGAILLNASQDLMRFKKSPKTLKSLGMQTLPDWGAHEEKHMQCSCGGAMIAANKSATLPQLEDANYFLGLALAAYGGPLVPMLPQGNWSHLKTNKCCCSNAGLDMDAQELANLDLDVAQAYLKGLPGHEECQVVLYTVEAGVGKPRFCVVVDKRKKLVIVSVRGTASLSDAFTDMCATSEEIPSSVVTGPGKGPHYVHKAMWEAAIYVENKLKKSGILDDLKVIKEWKATSPPLGVGEYARQQTTPVVKDHLPDCTGYRLAITGHSLGGGVATYVKARMSVHFPEVQCVGYGAPPLFSPDMEKFHHKNMYYVVMGDDVIARLGLRNMEFMRDRIVMLMTRCPFSKINIFLSGALFTLFGSERIYRQLRQFPFDPTEEAIQMMGRIVPRTAQAPTFHAGEQLWLRPEKVASSSCLSSCLPKYEYAGFWTNSEAVQEILIRKDAMRHHLPDFYTDGLAGAIKHCKEGDSISDACERDPLV